MIVSAQETQIKKEVMFQLIRSPNIINHRSSTSSLTNFIAIIVVIKYFSTSGIIVFLYILSPVFS
ncbi:hypothetical protein [Arcicella rosea]|uniref:hypothetical protein n=1 Tax=Arcicella rosea TaxID=502909 RepID=UPI0038D39723